MATREQVVAEARDWIGTPCFHQGRVKRVGVDCAGVVISVAKALCISQFDTYNYSRRPNPSVMRSMLDENMDRVAYRDLLPGDVIYFRVKTLAQHLGIVTSISPQVMMVHAYSRDCSEESLGDWAWRIDGCYRFRGLECS